MKSKDKLYLYLDDVRIPKADNWEVVRNYDEFVAHIKLNGLGAYEVISLDHDLGEGAMVEYYTNVKPNYELNYERIPEKTGMDCARFLVAESMNTKIPLPTIYIHSANPIGSANMIGYINNYFRNCKLPEVCMKVNIEHTYSEGIHMSEEERNKRYMILDKYKTK
jgi:hypothetical protein